MRRELIERGLRLALAALSLLASLAALAGLLGLGAPFQAAVVILALGIALWTVSRERTPSRSFLPDPWKAALLLSLCGCVGFAWAYEEGRPDPIHQFRFVVVPRHYTVMESLAPEPKTEVDNGRSTYGYGAQVEVTCEITGTDGHRWLRLSDLNFIEGLDLQPLPLTDPQLPECKG